MAVSHSPSLLMLIPKIVLPVDVARVSTRFVSAGHPSGRLSASTPAAGKTADELPRPGKTTQKMALMKRFALKAFCLFDGDELIEGSSGVHTDEP